MEQLGPVAAMVVFAYAFGVVWYHVLGRPTTNWLRMVGYPLMGIIVGEGFWAGYLVAGPEVQGIHVVVALFATFLAVSLDIAIESRGVSFPWRYIQSLSINGRESRRKRTKVGASAETER